jgi:hypothetical protein
VNVRGIKLRPKIATNTKKNHVTMLLAPLKRKPEPAAAAAG